MNIISFKNYLNTKYICFFIKKFIYIILFKIKLINNINILSNI